MFSYLCVLHGTASNDVQILGRTKSVRKMFLAFCNSSKFEFMDLQSILIKIILSKEVATCK